MTRLVDKTPLLTTALLEGANVGQLHRMWTEHTAEGQSMVAWVMVCFALLLWWNFYYRTMPTGKARQYALIGTSIGIVMNVSVILTVLYFRYFQVL